MAKCMRCGENHKSFECPYLVKQTDGKQKIPDDKIKCINCGLKHTSCFVDCTVRIEYIESRKRQQQHHQRTNKSFQTPNSGFINAPELHNFNFPSLNPHQRTSKQQQAWTNHNVPPKTSTNNDLFTPEECHSILMDLVTKLNGCKNKIEQFSAISSIAQKYMCS